MRDCVSTFRWNSRCSLCMGLFFLGCELFMQADRVQRGMNAKLQSGFMDKALFFLLVGFAFGYLASLAETLSDVSESLTEIKKTLKKIEQKEPPK